MGGGGSKPAAYEVSGYQIVTADGKQCLRVDPGRVVENTNDNRKHTSLGVAWGACNPDDPWQMWNAKEDGEDRRKYHDLLGKPGDYIRNARYINLSGKISVHNVGADGAKRFLYGECVSSLFDMSVAKCAAESDPFVKWFPDDYNPGSSYFRNVYYKSKYRHWEFFKMDSGDDKKVLIKYFISDSQADPHLYVNVCISKNAAERAVLAPCVDGQYLLFEPKGRKTVVQQTTPVSEPNAAAEWTANIPTPAPGPAPPLTDAPSYAPAPETTSALSPAPSALSPTPDIASSSPPYYYAPAPSPTASGGEENWWKKNQTMLLIGGGVLLCLCVFMIMAFVLFM